MPASNRKPMFGSTATAPGEETQRGGANSRVRRPDLLEHPVGGEQAQARLVLGCSTANSARRRLVAAWS